MFTSAALLFVLIVILVAGYFVVGKRFEEKYSKPFLKVMPSEEKKDGIDYYPSNPIVLFGHHFSSIAGAGPIVGPVLAVAYFGWGSVILWIILGSIFLGAVHDYLASIVSVKEKGISISHVSENISSLAKKLFGWFVWIALVLVIAAFTSVAATTLIKSPSLVIPTFGLIFVAVFLGYFSLNKQKIPLWLNTIISILMLAGLLYVGMKYPITASFKVWAILLIIYASVASVLPVWLLLQPRDYISSYVLIIGVVLAIIAIFKANFPITLPSISNVKTGMSIFPFLFITVACGAISGFHSLVASGTTSKQLAKEEHALPVVYGSMLAEAVVAIIATLAVIAGLKVSNYSQVLTMLKSSPLIVFAKGLASFLEKISIPTSIGIPAAILMINTFVMTTLDTSVRLGRLVFTELTGVDKIKSTIITVVIALILALSNGYKTIWPVFGATNQLIGALALLTISAYFMAKNKPTTYLNIAMIFMVLVTQTALFLKIVDFYKTAKYLPLIFAVVLMILSVLLLFEAIKFFRRMKKSG